MSPTIRAISKAGVPVIGQIGLTLQRDLDASSHGDESNDGCAGVLADAKSVQDAGAVAVVVEAAAPEIAAKNTSALGISAIGIG